MSHFALVCPPFPSHLHAFEAVAGHLVAHGHRVTFLLPGEPALPVRSNLGETVVFAAGTLSSVDRLERAGRPTGPFGILRTVRDAARATDALCEAGPAILSQIGADAVLGDETEPAAGLLARHLGLPQISIACALPMESDPALPPPFLDWPYDPTADGLKRNRGASRVARLMLSRQRRTIEEWAMRFSLAGLSTMEDCLSPDLTIAQTVEGLDFPRRDGTRIRHVGPLRGPEEGSATLPFAVDPGRPLVYASLGTLQGHRLPTFRAIAGAAEALGVQLVVAHCGGLTDAEAASLPALHVSRDLPQRAVLARADACITHGGLNTVLDALGFGVPILAIPIAFDQPGVAARLERSGAGLKLSRLLLSSRGVRAGLARLLAEGRFRHRAGELGREIAIAGGAAEAARLVEAVVIARGATPATRPYAEAAE